MENECLDKKKLKLDMDKMIASIKEPKMITYTSTSKYRGITHGLPRFLLKPWKSIMCKKEIHVFDEVWGSLPEHYLHCDACGLIVNIKGIDESWIER